MKKTVLMLMISLCLSSAFASKLSQYLNKIDEKDKAAQQREWQQDMNFSDMSFRYDTRYTNDRGQKCRAYVFRSRSNPYRHGTYTVCDDR